MSPLALERLGSTAIPDEFKNLVREGIPGVGIPAGSEWAATSTARGTDIGVNPGVGTFLLADLTLDLSGVPQMTQGLRGMSGSSLSSIASDLLPFRQMGPTDLLTMDGAGDSEGSPSEKIMQFGELEFDATFKLVPAGGVDAIFKFIKEEVNPKLFVGEITKETIESALAAITPELRMNLDCTGVCENFESIKIGQQGPKLYKTKAGGTTVPVVNISFSLQIEADVITAPTKVISPCVTEEELDFRRKKKEYDRKDAEFRKALEERASKSAKGEPPGPMPKPPGETPEPPDKEKRSKPGKQVQQDFIIRWDYTIKFSLLEIERTDRLYGQTVTRYSPCCPVAPAAVPIPPAVPPEGEGEEKDKQKELFLAGWQEFGQAVTHHPRYSYLPRKATPEPQGKEEALIEEDQPKRSFFVGLADIAVSAEKLATKFLAALPGEQIAGSPNINAPSFGRTRTKVPSEDT